MHKQYMIEMYNKYIREMKIIFKKYNNIVIDL